MSYYGRDAKSSLLIEDKKRKITAQILGAVDKNLVSKDQLMLIIDGVLKQYQP